MDAPGLLLEHATHLASAALFTNIHELHSQEPSTFLNASPKLDNGALLGADGRLEVPGLAPEQATHFDASALLVTIHVSHSHEPSVFLNLSPNPNTGALVDDKGGPDVVTAEVPGLTVQHATHFFSSALLTIIHVSHSHDPSGFLNLSPKSSAPDGAKDVDAEEIGDTGAVGRDTVFTAAKAEGSVNEGLSPVPGFAVSQATHFTDSGLF